MLNSFNKWIIRVLNNIGRWRTGTRVRNLQIHFLNARYHSLVLIEGQGNFNYGGLETFKDFKRLYKILNCFKGIYQNKDDFKGHIRKTHEQLCLSCHLLLSMQYSVRILIRLFEGSEELMMEVLCLLISQFQLVRGPE